MKRSSGAVASSRCIETDPHHYDDGAPHPTHPDAHAGAAVVISSATKTFQGGHKRLRALEELSLQIREGEVLSLIGPSGCGKSTLLMLIAGLDEPSSGSVSIRGTPVAGPRLDVGVIFQRDLLFDWRSVLDNVLLPFAMRGENPKPHREHALSLLDQVGLRGFEKRRPYELSGGMRQRVALCRGLIQDPSIVLLDEPFAALDALTREQLQLDLQRLWGSARTTAVIVTHDIAEAVFMSDRIAVMTPRPGQICELVEVDLPRPRTAEVRESAAFAERHARVHKLFEKLGVING